MYFFKKKDKNFKIDNLKINHIAFIMDGNRRFSNKIGKSKKEGYSYGMEQFLEVVKFQIEYNIKETSFFALSNDNYKKRSENELKILKDLVLKFHKSDKIKDFFEKNKIKISIVGNLKEVKSDLKKKTISNEKKEFITEALNFEKEIKNWVSKIKNPKFKVNICLNYDGQEEILHSFKEILKKIKSGNLKEKEINTETIKNNLYFSKSKPPEIIVRPGNAPRLSGFMLWDSKYSEIYFTKKLWPELTKEDLRGILVWYSNIKRNFGK
jgi:undecaprenyl diphosphate synthase